MSEATFLALHQEVRRTHAHLQRPERMLDRLTALPHRLRVLIKALLRGLHDILVLPPGDDTVLGLRAARFEWACHAGMGPISELRPSARGAEFGSTLCDQNRLFVPNVI